MPEFGLRLRDSVEKIDDDVRVEKGDHIGQFPISSFIPFFAQSLLQGQAIPLRWHRMTLRPQSKTSAF